MATFYPLVNLTEPVRHAMEIIRTEIDTQLAHLSTKEQREFWTELHGYALARLKALAKPKVRPPLIAANHVEESVRRALELIDEHLLEHMESLSPADQRRFWEVLHEQAERLMEETKDARAGKRSLSST